MIGGNLSEVRYKVSENLTSEFFLQVMKSNYFLRRRSALHGGPTRSTRLRSAKSRMTLGITNVIWSFGIFLFWLRDRRSGSVAVAENKHSDTAYL